MRLPWSLARQRDFNLSRGADLLATTMWLPLTSVVAVDIGQNREVGHVMWLVIGFLSVARQTFG